MSIFGIIIESCTNRVSVYKQLEFRHILVQVYSVGYIRISSYIRLSLGFQWYLSDIYSYSAFIITDFFVLEILSREEVQLQRKLSLQKWTEFQPSIITPQFCICYTFLQGLLATAENCTLIYQGRTLYFQCPQQIVKRRTNFIHM